MRVAWWLCYPHLVPFNIAELAHALACSLGCKIIQSLCVAKGPAVQDRDRHLQYGTFKDMVAPRLQETIVMQQINQAAATGLDADLIKGVLIGRRQQSLAKSAEMTIWWICQCDYCEVLCTKSF